MLRILSLFLVIVPILAATPPTSPVQYIVTLNTYHPLSVQESLVRTLLSLNPARNWQFVRRSNLAARSLPTDFVLLESAQDDISHVLRRSSKVRSVTKQAQHARAPRAIFTPTDEAGGSDRSEGSPPPPPAIHAFGAGAIWARGHLGEGVNIAVFDTGLIANEEHFFGVVENTDWTGENTTVDTVGHGTFVAGLIAGSHPACPGIAPHARLHTFRVFTGAQVSYTSWFLDAFNYALHIGIDVLNLSIGGPDFADDPFTEKVNELTANGIIVVSAIGNDGPLWGSLNNPGDMMDVVGVGGAEPDGTIAKFSSRGMTTHELDSPYATYGRVKPDLVAYGRSLVGPSHKSAAKCRRLSGTSVASPVVAGAIALLLSTVPESRRRKVANPASIKRALIHSSDRLRGSSMYEQGAGILNINDAFDVMQVIDAEFLATMRRTQRQKSFSRRLLSSKEALLTRLHTFHPQVTDENIPRLRHSVRLSAPPLPIEGESATEQGPKAALFPSFFDLTETGCPHMWPHCAQPLFKGVLAVNLNITVLNPGGVHGRIENITWTGGINGQYMRVKVTPPQRFWPWAAGVGIHITIAEEPTGTIVAEGLLRMRVISVHEQTHSDVELPIKVSITQAPRRENRLLWDVYHSIRYPPGYVPRDNLAEGKDMLDWLGDHPHTNFHGLFRSFLHEGFYVEVLNSPLPCMPLENLRQYGALLLLDSEDFFSQQEKKLIEDLVHNDGLVLVVAAEWYNADVMADIRFEDDNTRSWWSPVVAGGNVPALNALLAPFGVAFGDSVMSGDVKIRDEVFRFASGVPLVQFPPGGEVIRADSLKKYVLKRSRQNPFVANGVISGLAVFGLTKSRAGCVIAYGDSNCLDTAYNGGRCYTLLVDSTRHALSHCGGTSPYKRFLPDSDILPDGLTPTNDGLRRVALAPTETALDLFRPHSKTLSMLRRSGTSILPTSSTVTASDEASFCLARKGLQLTLPPTFPGTPRARVAIPLQRYADPLGSEGRYFQSVGQAAGARRMHGQYGGAEGGLRGADAGGVVDVGRAMWESSRLRPLVMITGGLVLVVGSMAIRARKGGCIEVRGGSIRSVVTRGGSDSRRTWSSASFLSVLSSNRVLSQVWRRVRD